MEKIKSLGISGGVIATLLFSLWFGFNCWTVTPAGHGKVGVLFGSVDQTPLDAGFSFVNPLKKFVKYDLKDQSYTWDDVGVPAQDKLTSKMDVTVVFETLIESTPTIYSTIGTLDDVIVKHFTKKVMSVMREVGKSVENSQDFFTDETQQMMQDFMETSLDEYFTPKGLNIKSVMFSDVQLPGVVTQAVIKTKQRQEELNQEIAQLQIVEQQQLKAVKKAEATNLAATQLAEAEIKRADAKAYATLKVKTAEAEGNRKLNKSITPDLVAYVRAKGWNGKLPDTVLGDTIPMLSIK